MNYEKHIKYSTEEFILDEDFMQWVLHPNTENDLYWKTFLQQNPKKRQQVKEASTLILSIRAVETEVSSGVLEQIYQNAQLAAKPVRKIGWMWTKVAAVFFLLATIGGLLYYLIDKENTFPMELATTGQLEKGRVILPDGTITEFESEQTQISQTAAGDLTINNDTLKVKETSVKAEEQNLTQVIVPYGKRSEITLVDGTKIWLNSGSQFSYPVSFTGSLRQVYLAGEAFFEVESDLSKPFYVITGDMKIRVTGTRFNVTSYANDEFSQVVLLSGKIDATKNKRFARSVELQPGERIVYNRKEDNIEKDRVDGELYASWVNGYLIFENEPLEYIFKKLERYYNINILIEKHADQSTFSGKLDLTNDIEKVLGNIAFSASFSVEFKNDTYIIKPKNP